MAKLLSVSLAAVCFVGLLMCTLTHEDGESWKPVFGAAWGTLVFVTAYFGLCNLERWGNSKEFKNAGQEFLGLVSVEMPTAEAEELLQKQATLIDVSDRRYFGGRYENRTFRVAEFDARLCRLKLLSLEGKVFEIQSEPKR